MQRVDFYQFVYVVTMNDAQHTSNTTHTLARTQNKYEVGKKFTDMTTLNWFPLYKKEKYEEDFAAHFVFTTILFIFIEISHFRAMNLRSYGILASHCRSTQYATRNKQIEKSWTRNSHWVFCHAATAQSHYTQSQIESALINQHYSE